MWPKLVNKYKEINYGMVLKRCFISGYLFIMMQDKFPFCGQWLQVRVEVGPMH